MTSSYPAAKHEERRIQERRYRTREPIQDRQYRRGNTGETTQERRYRRDDTGETIQERPYRTGETIQERRDNTGELAFFSPPCHDGENRHYHTTTIDRGTNSRTQQ